MLNGPVRGGTSHIRSLLSQELWDVNLLVIVIQNRDKKRFVSERENAGANYSY